MSSTLKQRTAQGLLWGGISNGLTQLLGALFGLALLNLLTPADYGRMAALVVFTGVAGCLQESGFTAALANLHEARHEAYNAVFWFNVIAGTLLYILLFAAAPCIAAFYHDAALQPLARFVFVGLWVSSLGISQQAWLFSHLQVKQVSLINLTSLVVSNVAGIFMAWRGLAYWALAAQSVLYTAVGTSLRWWVSPWRPTMHIDLRPAWHLFGFSSRLLVGSLATQLNNNAFGVLLNRFYPGGHVAGIFSNARKWDDMAIATIGGMVQGVAQPVLRESSRQPSPDTPTEATAPHPASDGLRDAPATLDPAMCASTVPVFRKLLRFTAFVSFPCFLGLALIAEDFIVLLAGWKWHASSHLLSLLCLYGAFSPIATLYSNLVISRGRSTVNMTISLLNCALLWSGIIALHAAGRGLVAMVVFYVILNVSWLLVWQSCARRLAGISWLHALRDTLPFLAFAAMVMCATWWLTRDMCISWPRLLSRIAIAVLLYVGILYVARARILRESLRFILRRGNV